MRPPDGRFLAGPLGPRLERRQQSRSGSHASAEGRLARRRSSAWLATPRVTLGAERLAAPGFLTTRLDPSGEGGTPAPKTFAHQSRCRSPTPGKGAGPVRGPHPEFPAPCILRASNRGACTCGTSAWVFRSAPRPDGAGPGPRPPRPARTCLRRFGRGRPGAAIDGDRFGSRRSCAGRPCSRRAAGQPLNRKCRTSPSLTS